MALLPILIAGGGIAGLAAALGFARQGRDSIVFEQTKAFEEIGAGLQLGPNAVKALAWLGAWDAVEPSCVAPAEILVRDGHSGKLLQRIALGSSFTARFGAPYRVAHRADLLHGLVQTAKFANRIELRLNSRISDFEDRLLHVDAILASGGRISGSHLIGADGIHSAIRQKLVGDGPPSYRGHTIYRALLDKDAVPSAVEWQAVCLWLCKSGHLVHYPVSGGGKLNVVAAIDHDWVSTRWNEADDGEALQDIFRRAAPPLSALLEAISTWRKWAAADRAVRAAWVKDKVILTGDAAHASLPYLAQGAAMALEDAVVLARHLDAPDTYAKLRQARTARVQAASRQLGRIYHLGGAARRARNLVMTMTPPIQDRLTWLYGYDPAPNK
jgi:salicylate hydroxylase